MTDKVYPRVMHVDLEAGFPDTMVTAIPDCSGTMQPEWIAAAQLQQRGMKDINPVPVWGDIHGVPPMIVRAGQMGGGKSWNLVVDTNDAPPSSHTYSRKRKKSTMRKNRSK